MHIRRATIDDIELIVPLFDAYRVFYNQFSDLAGARTFLTDRIAKDEVIFVAFDDDNNSNHGAAVGFTQLSFSSVSMQRLWILNDLFVTPSSRRLGVADALMERAEKYAKETSGKGLILETATTNIAAQALYERRNWVRATECYTYTFKVTKPDDDRSAE